MDNLTHSLTGLALARAGLSRSTPGATAALVLGSNLPDIDILTSFLGPAVYLQHHRDLTHSVVGAPLLAVGLALGLRAAVRGARLLPLLLCNVVAIAGHVFMDLWTSYGTRVLAPFDRTWYTWDLVFIVDPLILLLLGAGLFFHRSPPPILPHVISASSLRRLLAERMPPLRVSRGEEALMPDPAPRLLRWQLAASRPAAAAIALVLVYVAGRASLHARAFELASERVPSQGLRRLAVLPTPIDPTRWRLLADAGSSYWTGEVRLRGEAAPLQRRDKRAEDAVVARVRETSEVAAIFLDFSPFPWLEVAEIPGGTEVSWRDLRFERQGQERFVTRVVIDHDGRIRSEEFQF